MLLGYNTNGFAHHRLTDAMQFIAELGYQAVAITLDHHTLNPYAPTCQEEIAEIRELTQALQLSVVVETGARYLLNPRVKHEPTLVSPEATERQQRIDFLCRAIDTAADLESNVVSLWSGIVHDEATHEVAFERLISGLLPVLDHATQRGVQIAFEPEPGMLIDTMAKYDQLKASLASEQSRSDLKLTIDIGHLHCQQEVPIAEVLHRYSEDLVNVHLEDMRAGVHEHLPFGEGEIDFVPVINMLKQIGYTGPLCVELSRDSHRAPEAARQSIDFLHPLCEPRG